MCVCLCQHNILKCCPENVLLISVMIIMVIVKRSHFPVCHVKCTLMHVCSGHLLLMPIV